MLVSTTDGEQVRQERKHGDFIQGSLTSVVGWFPDLPRPFKVLASTAFLYLVFCFVAQVKPQDPPVAIGEAIRQYVAESRAESRKERDDIVALLRETNADLKAAAVMEREDRAEALRVARETRDLLAGLEGRVSELERRVDAHEGMGR